MVNEKKVRHILLMSRLQVYGVTIVSLLTWMLAVAVFFQNSKLGFGIFVIVSVPVLIFTYLSGIMRENSAETELSLQKDILTDRAVAEKRELSDYWDVMHEVVKETGMKYCPTLIVTENEKAQAGMTPDFALMLATENILKRLGRAELKAIVLHEIGHVFDGDRDDSLECIIAAVIRTFKIFCPIFFALGIISHVVWGNGSMDFILAVSASAYAFGYMVGPRMRAFVLQQREFRADIYAAERIGKEIMIAALEKILGPEDYEVSSIKTLLYYKADQNDHPSPDKRYAYLAKLG